MPEPGPLPTWKRQLPLVAVLVVMVAGLTVLTLAGSPENYRVGLSVVAASLVIAAVARVVLPARRVGLLAVRSRPFDVLAMLGIAAAIAVLGISLPPPG